MLPFNLPDSVHPEVHEAFRQSALAIQDCQQAILGPGGLLEQIKGLKNTTSGAASTTVIQNTETVNPGTTSNVGSVNNQSGNTSYATQQSDNAAMIVLSDASPVALTLSSGVNVPWFCIPVNQGVGLVTMTPASGTINGVPSLPIPSGYFAVVAFDGANFWAAMIPVPAFQSLTTIGTGAATLTAGVLNIPTPVAPSGYSGTITTAKLTSGGTNGSMSFSNGVLTAQVAAT
jgi:hypothetical protein